MKSAKYWREELEEKDESASVESIRQIQADAIRCALDHIMTRPAHMLYPHVAELLKGLLPP